MPSIDPGGFSRKRSQTTWPLGPSKGSYSDFHSGVGTLVDGKYHYAGLAFAPDWDMKF